MQAPGPVPRDLEVYNLSRAADTWTLVDYDIDTGCQSLAFPGLC